MDPMDLLSQMTKAYGAQAYPSAPQAPQSPRPMDPLLQQMLGAGVADDRVAALNPRLRRAQGLMQTPGAEGMRVGGTYQAASPLEHLATAMSRIVGNRQMGDVEKQVGGLIDQKVAGRKAYYDAGADPMLGALSGDSAMGAAGGVRQTQETQAANRYLAGRKIDADLAQQEAEAARYSAQMKETERHNRAVESGADAARGQDAYGAVADPVTGRIILFNKKTGQRLGEEAPAGPPAPGGPLPGIPGKPTDSQKAKVLGASEAISQLDLAIDALKKAPGAYGGVGNFVAGLAETAGGTPAQSILSRRYNADELRAKNQISNVVSKIINERAGANVTLREELRQKFLPQDTDGYDQATQKLGDLRSMMTATYETQGNGLVPPASPRADAPQVNPADAAAKQWAEANPNDPRAARILQSLKAKGL